MNRMLIPLCFIFLNWKCCSAFMVNNVNVDNSIVRSFVYDGETLQVANINFADMIATPPHSHFGDTVVKIQKGSKSVNGQLFETNDTYIVKSGQKYTSLVHEPTKEVHVYVSSCPGRRLEAFHGLETNYFKLSKPYKGDEVSDTTHEKTPVKIINLNELPNLKGLLNNTQNIPTLELEELNHLYESYQIAVKVHELQLELNK